ncbi:MAG: hypothetical protein NTU81_03245 [Candidatus Nomurabacteria bacterium]|nr:hypothetical protein [Candidatus Nomurabacteria bacterium]
MDTINQLQLFYNQRQEEYRAYLESELQKFKDANNNYLSAVIAEACEHAKALFENSNETCFKKFLASKKQAEDMRVSGSNIVAGHIESSAKKFLDMSLEFNKQLFDQSVAYYKSVLKS